MIVATAYALLLAFPLELNAEARKLKGSESPEFAAAVQMWLQGDDLDSLEELSKLARSENRAAQVLLASIANRGILHRHATSGLTREERIALLRIPGGLSGRSWIAEAAKDEPLATALLQLSKSEERAAAIAALFELGEAQTALLAVESMLYRGDGKALIDLYDRLPAEAQPLLHWLLYQAKNSGLNEYVGSALAAIELDAEELSLSRLDWIALGPLTIVENRDVARAVTSLNRMVKPWTPVRSFCEERCQDTADACTTVGASLLFGMGAFPLRSPLESAIPNSVYWSSPRMEGDLARATLNAENYRKCSDGICKGYFDNINVCFIREMAIVQREHGFRE